MVGVTVEDEQGQTIVPIPADDNRNFSGCEQPDILHLRSLREAPALIALVSGPDHVYEFVNDRHIQVLGDRDYLGRPAREVIPEAIEQGLIDILDRVFATGKPFIASEMPLRFTHGRTGPLEQGFYNFIYQPLFDSSGTVTGIMIHAVKVTDEVVTRRRLEELAAQHAATLSQMADGVIIVDPSGHVTFQNEAARRLLRMDAVGLAVEDWLATIHLLTCEGDPIPTQKTRLARTVELGELNVGVERRIRLPDGTDIIIEGSAVPVTAQDGSRYGSVITFRDITERKRMEEELVVRARQQEAVAGLGHGALANLHLDQLIQEAMNLVVEMLHVDSCQLLERLAHEDDFIVRSGRGLPDGMAGEAPVGAGTASQAGYTVLSSAPVIVEDLRTESRFTVPSDIREQGVISSLSTVVQGSDQPIGVLEAHSRARREFTENDVHFLRSVANVLAAAIERHRLDEARFTLAALVESWSDAIIGATLDGEITSWDRGAEHLYGYTAAEAVGRPTTLIVPSDRADEIRAVMARVRRGESAEHIETVRRHKDGHAIDTSVSVSPVRDASGTITGALSIAHDIGRRKRLEREHAQHHQELVNRVLQAQEDERKRIARELHDETVQDLTTLLINIDVAERHLPEGSDEAGIALSRVRSIARRSLDEARTLAHSLRPPILDDVGLEAALEALGEEYAQTYNLAVVVQAAEPNTDVPPYLQTVLFRVAQEALTNACKHGGGSEVRILFTVTGGLATLRVEDNGRGFDLHHMAIHERHSGLGLHGMRERAALASGDLEIDTAPGRGTRVVLTVPLDGSGQLHPAPATSGGRQQTVQSPAWLDVLLVDDHAMVREGLKLILENQAGIRIAGEAEDGHQAIELVERLRPHVVVMDIAMPDLNGLDATRQIKRRFPAVKILILTSHEERQYVTQIAKVGADGCLLKRSAGTELITALETVREGRSYVSPSMAGMLLDDYRVRIDRGGDDQLTEREREVVQLVAEGHTNQGISRKLGISIKTVETHRTNIMEKLGAADRTDLVKYAIRTGMISAD